MSRPARPRVLAGAAATLAALALVHLALILPNHPRAMTLDALRLLPLELPLVVAVLVLAPAPARGAVRAAVAFFLAAMVLVKLADLGAFLAYDRAFNPLLDTHLVSAAWNLASGALGVPAAAAAAGAAAAGVALLGGLLWWATGRLAALPRPRRLAGAVVLAGCLAVVAADLAAPRWLDPPGSAFTARLAREHAAAVVASRADLAQFRAAAARDPYATLPPSRLLADLSGTDVFLIFVESYGRATLDDPRYAATVRDRLLAIGRDVDAAGLDVRSAWLEAPVIGGQSWLSHASVLSGLWIDNQRRYQALLRSDRRTLMHHAAQAGFRTVAAMPAITLPWPEAEYFGYDRILAAADLGYAGPPFNWVTMPDQYTLAALERLALDAQDRAPVFAEVALISSHAPWTPIPPLIDWERVGDGGVFAAWAGDGDPPDVVWRDRDRVRDQFRQAVDYALAVVGSFAARRAPTAPLIVVMGDHPPASFVTDGTGGRQVPVHVIGPPRHVAELDAWGWSPGMVPAADAPVWRMDAFRDRFLDAFSPGPAIARGAAAAGTGDAVAR